MDADIVVYLHDGEYALRETVMFEPRDSGRGGNKVIYCAAPGSSPVLTGGVRVTDWQVFDPDKNIYRSHVATKLFRQLYIDGKPGLRARTPNKESETDRSPYWLCTLAKQKPKVAINKEYWRAVADVPPGKLDEVEMVMICHWYHQRMRIGDVDASGPEDVVVTPVEPEGKFNKKYSFYKTCWFYFENALAFVDTPYEWYHDPDDGNLYLALPRGVTPEGLKIQIPVIETLVSLEGTVDSPVQDIEFSGITFETTNWTGPSLHGVNMTQAAQVIEGEQPPAAVSARHTRRLAFRNNIFRDAGGQGISLFDADTTDIEGNMFMYVAANGIVIDQDGGKNPSDDKQSVNVAIWNNNARRCGDHYANGMFLFTENVKGLIVEHNLIYDLPYSGMQIGQQPGDMQNVGAGNNIIRFNHIHHCTQIHGDGGGIYTLGGIQEGTVIASNYLHDIRRPKWDTNAVSQIYLDNRSSKITVRDNVVNRGKAQERNGSKDNTFINNTQSNPAVEAAAGIKAGYNPRLK